MRTSCRSSSAISLMCCWEYRYSGPNISGLSAYLAANCPGKNFTLTTKFCTIRTVTQKICYQLPGENEINFYINQEYLYEKIINPEKKQGNRILCIYFHMNIKPTQIKLLLEFSGVYKRTSSKWSHLRKGSERE